MKKLSINEYLDLRLEDGKTNIYVSDKLFIQCKYLLLNIPNDEIEVMGEKKSIDEISEKLDKSLEFSDNKAIELSPEIQFMGHCSNLQAWYENNYSTCLVHRNLAFPLLKKLAEAGDSLAKKVFKEEIAERFASGHLSVVQFLLYNGYLKYLNKEEIECVLDQSASNLTISVINELKTLLKESWKNYWKITNLIEIILFLALNYDENYFFKIIENLPEKMKDEFVKKIILYLNYKEFKTYKIPYGKFFTLFERILEYIYNKYPPIFNSLKILESGYIDGRFSLDEMLSYGAVFF